MATSSAEAVLAATSEFAKDRVMVAGADVDSPLASEGEDDSGSVSTGSEDAAPSSDQSNAHSSDAPGGSGEAFAPTTTEETREEGEEEITWSLALQPRNLFKLVTIEDKYQVHKLIGVVALTHYVYRFASLLLTGTMGFEHTATWKIIFFFLVHLVLSWSSLIFHLPPRKNRMKPMIWPELRAHNIVFATRSIADALINTLLTEPQQRRVLGFVAVVIAMFAADLISEHYKKLELISKNESTMRSMPWPKDATPRLLAWANIYYALSQLFATAGVINVSRKWTTDVELALTTLFAIQISALLMTLVRKSILGNYAWHFWYQVALGLSWVLLAYRYSERSPIQFVILRTAMACFLAYHIRFRFNVNKYAMWTVFAIADGLFLDMIRHADLPGLWVSLQNRLMIAASEHNVAGL